MTEEQKAKLILQLKIRLRITWNNEKTNNDLQSLMDNAQEYLNHLLGAEIDYSAPGIENMLYIALCMYMWNDCTEEFEQAYQKDILRCRAIYEVKEHEKENAGTE